jgi:hypothetical protein
MGALTKTHLELRDTAGVEFLELLRFDQRGKLQNSPPERYARVRDECFKYPNLHIPVLAATEMFKGKMRDRPSSPGSISGLRLAISLKLAFTLSRCGIRQLVFPARWWMLKPTTN